MKRLALIPARANSKRIPAKNIRPIQGHPLVAYTIHVARESKIFNRIIVSTDSKQIAEISRHYGAEVPFMRPDKYALDNSPDILWMKHLILNLDPQPTEDTLLFILRPTNPLRTISGIKEANDAFIQKMKLGFDSLRAMEIVKQHPAKMWEISIETGEAVSIFNQNQVSDLPLHSQPFQNLPTIYMQTASLEITTVKSVLVNNSISGNKIFGWLCKGHEGFDLNTEEDWDLFELYLQKRIVTLPEIS